MRETLPQATPLVIVALPIVLGMLDLLLYWLGGNDATISKVMLNIAGNRPLVALSTAYSFAVLMGHFFFPTWTEKAPPTYEVLARMVLVLSPTLYAMIIIGAGNGVARSHEKALESGGQLPLALYMLAAIIVGGLAGKYALPQHITPDVAQQIHP